MLHLRLKANPRRAVPHRSPLKNRVTADAGLKPTTTPFEECVAGKESKGDSFPLVAAIVAVYRDDSDAR